MVTEADNPKQEFDYEDPDSHCPFILVSLHNKKDDNKREIDKSDEENDYENPDKKKYFKLEQFSQLKKSQLGFVVVISFLIATFGYFTLSFFFPDNKGILSIWNSLYSGLLALASAVIGYYFRGR